MDLKHYIIFNDLCIELTRRCNLKCQHCAKGEAQDIDISDDTINALLERTGGIYQLLLTGGEVTLCPDRMRYLLEGLKKHNIPLGELHIITNGVIQSNEIVEIIKDYHDYISGFLDAKYSARDSICVGISFDEFHDAKSSETGYKFYSEQLDGVARVFKHSVGRVPFAKGRAQSLPYALNMDTLLQDVLNMKPTAPKQIGYITTTHCPVCPARYQNDVTQEGQIQIACSVELTVNGMLRIGNDISSDEADNNTDLHICPIAVDHDNLLEALEQYNLDKLPCKCGMINDPETNNILDVFTGSTKYLVQMGKSMKVLNYVRELAKRHSDPEEYENEVLNHIIFRTMNEQSAPNKKYSLFPTKYPLDELLGASLELVPTYTYNDPLTDDQKSELSVDYFLEKHRAEYAKNHLELPHLTDKECALYTIFDLYCMDSKYKMPPIQDLYMLYKHDVPDGVKITIKNEMKFKDYYRVCAQLYAINKHRAAEREVNKFV